MGVPACPRGTGALRARKATSVCPAPGGPCGGDAVSVHFQVPMWTHRAGAGGTHRRMAMSADPRPAPATESLCPLLPVPGRLVGKGLGDPEASRSPDAPPARARPLLWLRCQRSQSETVTGKGAGPRNPGACGCCAPPGRVWQSGPAGRPLLVPETRQGPPPDRRRRQPGHTVPTAGCRQRPPENEAVRGRVLPVPLPPLPLCSSRSGFLSPEANGCAEAFLKGCAVSHLSAIATHQVKAPPGATAASVGQSSRG